MKRHSSQPTGLSLFRRITKPLPRDRNGATAVEFALLAPTFLALLLGVVTMGTYLQNINAMQSAANDTSRQVMVAYQRKNKVQANEIQTMARGVAIREPYYLQTDRLDVTATRQATSRVPGATEYRLNLSYQLVALPMVPIDWLTVTYERPIFVV